jgi:hypothetical protein
MLAVFDQKVNVMKHDSIAARDIDVLHLEKLDFGLDCIRQAAHSYLLIK